LATPSSTPKFNLTFVGQDGRRSSISLSFDLASHQSIDAQLGQSMLRGEA